MAPFGEAPLATSATAHFVMVPLMAQGHMIPMVDLACLLAERGALVSLLTTPVNLARLRGVADRAARSKLPLEFVELPFSPAEAGLPPECENVDLVADNNQFLPLFNAMRALRSPLESYVRAQARLPSCIISDWCHTWTADVARAVGVPRLFFHGPSCFYSLCDLNAAAHGLYEGAADSHGGERYVVPGMPLRVEVTRATGPGFFNAPGWEGLRDEAMEAMRTADGAVVNTFLELEAEFVACYEAALGKPVWALGPFCLYNKDVDAMASRGKKAAVDAHEVVAWLDTMPPSSVVYVSFGSLVRMSPEQLFELGHGLEASGKPFLWVVKESQTAAPEVVEWLKSLEARTAGRGLVVRGWAPQLAVLSHRAAGCFVTHCGWNSMLESVACGVPMVTWPRFADQFLNERLAVELLGIGAPVGATAPVMIFDKEATPVDQEDIARAVSAVMGGGAEAAERRRKAREYGEKAHRAMEEGGSSYTNLTQLIASFSHTEWKQEQ